MTALVHIAEIEREYDCSHCAQVPEMLAQRGCCVGPAEGPLAVPVWARDRDGELRKTSDLFSDPSMRDEPLTFATCPRGLVRHDINPDGFATAVLVAHASHAEVRRSWPDVPAKLWDLVSTMERARDLRDNSIQRAALDLAKR